MTRPRSRPCRSVDFLRPASSRSALVALCAAGLAVLGASHAAAQFAPGGVSGGATTAVGGAPFIEAWVDFEIATFNANQVPPITPEVGCPDRPFATINAATNAIRIFAGTPPFPPLSAENPGLVHVMPGIYGPATNGEQLPIQMWEFISIQGQSARACVIRGTGETPNTFAFVPFTPLGDRAFWEVLADFSFLTDDTYVEFMDGFTFQSGQIQIYCEPEEVDCQWRVSNCVFDMLNMSDVGLPGPEFGILMSHTYDADYALVKGPKGKPVGVGGYHDVEAHIINNTFIQGWQPGNDGTVITATETSVAICDVANTLWNDPLFPNAERDPFVVLRGVGNPNIQNNLIRALDDAPRTAFLGIDDADTRVILGVPAPAPGGSPSNAFDPTQALDTNGTYDSLIVASGTGPLTAPVIGVVPVPAVIPNASQGGRDPGFLGEMLGQFGGNPIEFSRDWRILFPSTLFDQGFAPNAVGLLGALNGTTHDDTPALLVGELANVHPVFDFDGEGYGNLRTRFSRPDIGFDELDLIAIAGATLNDTLTDPTAATLLGVQCPTAPAIPPLLPPLQPFAISPLPAAILMVQSTTLRPYTTFGIPFAGVCGLGNETVATSAPTGSLVASINNDIWVDGALSLLSGVPTVDPLVIPNFFPDQTPGFPTFGFTTTFGTYVPLNDPGAAFLVHGMPMPAQPTGWGPTCITTVEQGFWVSPLAAQGFFTNMQTTHR
jgi:hypothetical protein